MAQLRQDQQEFEKRNTELIVVGPDKPNPFRAFWEKHGMSFIGIPDPQHRVAHLYGQQVRWLKLGRMPSVVVIDKAGNVRYRHFGDSMRDIPPNREVLAVLDGLNEE